MVVAEVNGIGVGKITNKGKIIKIRVEAVVSERKHALLIFGNVDPVLKEAFAFAFNAAKQAYESRDLGSFFAENKVTVSVPPPTTLRKGPSASALAILSLATGRRVQPGVCVTGELIRRARSKRLAR
ncbi:hypothetical protein niasHT_014493 [Heterodera trifolii]|uniref:Lon proteolytic domain-containing protein n=1 Tax=Heterodera trifolii TaxID=157864 RepID=A0ABD2KZJ7_9BILA